MNLLEETLREIERSGHAPTDVVYIGSRDGYACTWEEFTRLADRDYDNGYGGQEVAEDLEIHFGDGDWLERWEYDGSEGWSWRRAFRLPAEREPIERLMRDDTHDASWQGLAALHDEEQW